MQTKQFLLSVAIMSLMAGCAQGQQQSSKSTEGKKILVVYYSWGGNTREVANQIQKTTGGDIFEIVPVTPYPSDYQACVDQAKKEIADGVKPPLKSNGADTESYDIIFVGTPNWWSTIAPPVATFLSENNLAGKTIVPFCTHGGGREAQCFTDMAKLCPKSTMLNGLVVPGNRAKEYQNEVDKWLKDIQVVK